MRDDECDIKGECTANGDISTRTDIENEDNYTVHRLKPKGGRGNTWRLPFLTGFNYFVYMATMKWSTDTQEWVKNYVDFNSISIDVTRDWQSGSATDSASNKEY